MDWLFGALPGGQVLQDFCPLVSWNRPLGQSAHPPLRCDMRLPYRPRSHPKQAAAPPSSGVSWPTLQLSHSVAPGVDANVFVSHLEHSARPSMLLARPGMHGRHAARPVAFWCVPAAQGVHAAAFCVAEKRPAAQRAQVWSVAFRRFPALHAAQVDYVDVIPIDSLLDEQNFSIHGSFIKPSATAARGDEDMWWRFNVLPEIIAKCRAVGGAARDAARETAVVRAQGYAFSDDDHNGAGSEYTASESEADDESTIAEAEAKDEKEGAGGGGRLLQFENLRASQRRRSAPHSPSDSMPSSTSAQQCGAAMPCRELLGGRGIA